MPSSSISTKTFECSRQRGKGTSSSRLLSHAIHLNISIRQIAGIKDKTLTFHTTLAQYTRANIALDSLQYMVQAHIQHAENGHLGNKQPLASSCQASEIEGYKKVMNDKVVDEICKK
jgi:hypothetical protein